MSNEPTKTRLAAVVPPPAAAVPGWDGKARGRNRKA